MECFECQLSDLVGHAMTDGEPMQLTEYSSGI